MLDNLIACNQAKEPKMKRIKQILKEIVIFLGVDAALKKVFGEVFGEVAKHATKRIIPEDRRGNFVRAFEALPDQKREVIRSRWKKSDSEKRDNWFVDTASRFFRDEDDDTQRKGRLERLSDLPDDVFWTVMDMLDHDPYIEASERVGLLVEKWFKNHEPKIYKSVDEAAAEVATALTPAVDKLEAFVRRVQAKAAEGRGDKP